MQSNQNLETIGTATGAVLGAASSMGGSVAAVSTAGTVAGLSGPGIASGLVALGGDSMVGGLVVVTGGTVVVAGALAYTGYRIPKKMKRPSGS